LTNAVDDQEIQRIVASNDVQIACRELIQLANINGGEDNITVVIFQAVE
jgi:protein phosphatase